MLWVYRASDSITLVLEEILSINIRQDTKTRNRPQQLLQFRKRRLTNFHLYFILNHFIFHFLSLPHHPSHGSQKNHAFRRTFLHPRYHSLLHCPFLPHAHPRPYRSRLRHGLQQPIYSSLSLRNLPHPNPWSSHSSLPIRRHSRHSLWQFHSLCFIQVIYFKLNNPLLCFI